ncbi:MAG: NPCBM/NEW2 domain-containing protein [Planctomycetales bacterium]|nr:NPCBM/NEW2 domain-containing protein [Planctomycetales bacterium]
MKRVTTVSFLRSVTATWLVCLASQLVFSPHGVAADKKKVVFMAGTASHGYGSHEHNAGCMLLAKSLQQTVDAVEVEVHRNGWPQDPKAFDGADVLVMYCDGGGGHPANKHLEQIEQLAKTGCGIVCIHYGVEVPKGEPGDRFLDWIGGYFETHWSVNPHWPAKFEQFPEHPISRGIKPFEINDEWYYHMRFRPEMKGVTPILTAVPPVSTLSRPDGAHSGNPDVRKTAGQPQHVAWASERPDGGRGFGFTGGHFHWNWADDNFRRVMLNAIVWCAKLEVPAGGVGDKRPTLEELEANQDEQPKANFDREAIRAQFHLSGNSAAAKPAAAAAARPAPVFRSDVITARTPGHAVAIDANIKGAKELYLVVRDGGNGFGCDWADWAEPKLVGPSGELKLTDLKWTSATSQFGEVRVNANAGGRPLRIDGKSVENGIGTHANSLIAYRLPEGYERFVARGGLDNGGTDQATCGDASSVQFLVYTQRPADVAASAEAESREPGDAVAGLDVHEGLEATLFASEPELLSLTNLDIDHRGRIWVCEVVNYRRHNGLRNEGDRILILEDTDGDGRCDQKKVFYQGREIDSAMGICVLGNRVIVSCSPNVWVFTDTDGDDKPDDKQLLFTKTGQPQHDHSAHSFLFGPDGKLYWNFGNTGQAVHDKDGNVVVDKLGRPVVDNGKPLFGGMPFRCDLDGSNFEVLAHNFRNNYEVTVDSFGALWQSDNDDDGNRGVRINFVMEHGNYGYREEGTGRGWRDARTGMHAEIPLRHWHLNDPGVVPNLLQTGAGSPTGITVYEGRLLPKVFWDQVIHCDAGPNVVRSYPVKPNGAGYEATAVNLLHGARDNWFRPADVCVAPDGSVFVTDWYDPGVGGHNMRDLERGRLFRIAPPGHRYQVKPAVVSTIEGAIEALQSPNLSTRYLAWTALHARGQEAVPALRKLFDTAENPRIKARALWLLGKTHGAEDEAIRLALAQSDENLRMVGLRLARQVRDSAMAVISQLVDDASPAVRRECAVALRGEANTPEAARLWAQLAKQFDGQDRWYLEALGIGAEGRWDSALDAYLAASPDATETAAGREVIWRSRATRTPELLVKLLTTTRDVSEAARWMRSFDFQTSSDKQAALLKLAFENLAPAPVRDFVAAEAVKRLDNGSLRDPSHAKALDAMLDRVRGQQQFVDLVVKFGLEKHYPALVDIARDNPENSLGVAAIVALLSNQQQAELRKALADSDPKRASLVAMAMANASDGRAARLLTPFVMDDKADLELRRQATRGMARSKAGAEQLLEMVRAKQLSESLTSSAAGALSSSPLPEIRTEALKLFPPPPSKDNQPIPAIRELVKLQGDIARGKQLFATTAQCANCHLVRKQGKEVGPDLSEIGKKLSREALFESILYPSAGISHNYENYLVRLEDGTVLNGILVSETDEQIVLKDDKAIVRNIPKADVERMRKLDISLMPSDLQKQMTIQDLLDVVEYLTTLKP